jgi:hypothetical protein
MKTAGELRMHNRKITICEAVSTSVAVEKAARIADECGVVLSLVDTRLRSDKRWINDFEVEGSPGKVEKFVMRLREIEMD